MEPAAQLLPLAYWAPLGATILMAQMVLCAVVLRPRRRALLLSAMLVVAVDIAIAGALRAFAVQMGRLDYSESFYTWRLWFLALCVTLVPVPIGSWALALWLANRGDQRPAIGRAMNPFFFTSLASWMAAAVITLALGGDLSFVPRPARITRLDVKLPGLDPRLDGVRVAVLSDHHVGALMTPGRARRRLASLAGARPDIVVELGDITDIDPSYQSAGIRLLEDCEAPLGVYAVAGNFDIAAGTDSLRAGLDEIGVTYLENEAARVSVRGAEIWIVGVGDPWTGQDDLDLALEEVPKGAPTILLAHSPDIVEEAAARRLPLVLCGHTHGGQVVAPFSGPIVGMSRFGTRFAAGRFTVGGTQLVVSRGLGEEAVPLRLFCRPEIVLLTLRAG